MAKPPAALAVLTTLLSRECTVGPGTQPEGSAVQGPSLQGQALPLPTETARLLPTGPSRTSLPWSRRTQNPKECPHHRAAPQPDVTGLCQRQRLMAPPWPTASVPCLC